MNILFLTIGRMESIESYSLYPDLLRQFRQKGHNVYVVSPYERRLGKKTVCKDECGAHMLHVKIGNLTKCNIIEKGITTVRIESQFINAIKKYFADVKFDLVMYSTPPITLAGVVKYIKNRDNASTYLLLKDIFPQNAVDLGMLKTKGIKGLLYRYFRKKEEKLYEYSDYIGCMSQANVDYIIRNNPEVQKEKVEMCPNCIDVRDMRISHQERIEMREKYGIPKDKKVFVYGGNLGKPQDVPYIISCLKKCSDQTNVCFVIVGSGTDRHLLEEYVKEEKPANVKLLEYLPKDEYDKMIACCDIGMIFLDHRFTIPNFPSRLLTYMQAGLPVLACTDLNTDVGKIIVDGDFGWWLNSDASEIFLEKIKEICEEDFCAKADNSYRFLQEHYQASKGYDIIMDSVCGSK